MYLCLRLLLLMFVVFGVCVGGGMECLLCVLLCVGLIDVCGFEFL